MSKPNKPKITIEDIEKLLPEALDFILLHDPHGHTKSGEPCVQWLLDKEDSLKFLRAYLADRLAEIARIKILLELSSRGGKEEIFYDHKLNRIYKRTVKDYGGHSDLRSFRKAFQDRAETSSEEEEIPF